MSTPTERHGNKDTMYTVCRNAYLTRLDDTARSRKADMDVLMLGPATTGEVIHRPGPTALILRG